MSILLNEQERQHLEVFAARKWKATKRQKAVAILEHARGSSVRQIAERTGITREELSRLLTAFVEHGLAGIGLGLPASRALTKGGRSKYATIDRTSGVCGQSARVSGTRIPVWVLVEARGLGVSEVQLLLDYPNLEARNLVDA